MKKRFKTDRVLLHLDADTIKGLTSEAKRLGIPRNEYINRSIFIHLHFLSGYMLTKDQIEVLKTIVGKDVDYDYYRTRAGAIQLLKQLKKTRLSKYGLGLTEDI
jgi:hypothetical protein